MERFTKTTKTVIRYSSFVIISVALLLCASCKKDKDKNNDPKGETIEVESVSVSPSSKSLKVGDKFTPTATVEPDDATNAKVTWSVTASTPDGVVTVNKNTGEITAVKAGTATVTATAGDETANCKITVDEAEPDFVAVTAITLSSASSVAAGTPLDLSAAVEPSDATNSAIVWTVTDAGTTEAIIEGNVLYAPNGGTVTITATIANGETATTPYTQAFDIEILDPSTTDEGVEINGVIWATRNIAAPGHFADNAYDAGMFYQWNRNIGWSVTDPLVNSNGGTTWDNTIPTGTVWEAANDPSPAGWHVPTQAELGTLLETSKVTKDFTANHGVNGFLFTDIATGNELFLPTAGYRAGALGTLYYPDLRGNYWGNTASDVVGRETYAHEIALYDSGSAGHYIDKFESGFSIRSAKKIE
jgi:uncharacterized protein YjdB